MFYTVNRSPLLVTNKFWCLYRIILSSYQKCPLSLKDQKQFSLKAFWEYFISKKGGYVHNVFHAKKFEPIVAVINLFKIVYSWLFFLHRHNIRSGFL